MENKVQYELMLPFEFETRMRDFPLVYVPVGSLEWHGEHMALGNDSIKIHAHCCQAATLSGGIVYPPFYYCIPGLTDFDLKKYKYNGTFYGRKEVLEFLLHETLNSLERIGFQAAIIITGHTSQEQKDLMRTVAEKYSGKMCICGVDDTIFANDMGHYSDHAAKWETSILWYYRPDLVDISQLPHDMNIKPIGVFGDDPRTHANPELGKNVSEKISLELAEFARQVLSNVGTKKS